jgi:hypothetical protein
MSSLCPTCYIYHHHIKLGNFANWEHNLTEVQTISIMHLYQRIISNTILTNLEGMLKISTKKPMLSKKKGVFPMFNLFKTWI